MATPTHSGDIADGLAAVAERRWEDAKSLLSPLVDSNITDNAIRAEAALGLSRAWWWMGDAREALRARHVAYESWRRLGEDAHAARTAAWLASEYFAALGNHAAARGWLTRAESLAGDPPDASVAGWLHLTRTSLEEDWPLQLSAAEEVLAMARKARDTDLEARALARIGLGRILDGDLDGSLSVFHEAMAMATGGETTLETLGHVLCDLMKTVEVWGDLEPFAQWNELVIEVASEDGHPALISFCASCCAEVFSASGDWAEAEQQLRAAMDMLNETDNHARCVSPTAKLAELLILQGRLEEAEVVVAEYQGEASMLAEARLAMAQGRPAAAQTLLERLHRRQGGDSLLTAHVMAMLVDAHLAVQDEKAADDMARRLTEVAEQSGNRRASGWAALAQARVLSASSQTKAIHHLEEAIDHLTAAAPGAVELGDAHLELARFQVDRSEDVALMEAKTAGGIFESAGATHKSDEAAALARELGDRSRVGPKNLGTLTRREEEVLRLVAQGLTNAEIAERLYISPKTAGNHVSNILTKLNLRSRVEAAAYAHRVD